MRNGSNTASSNPTLEENTGGGSWLERRVKSYSSHHSRQGHECWRQRGEAPAWSLGRLGPLSGQGRDSTCLRRPQQVKERKREKREKRKLPFSRQSFNETASMLQGPMPSSSMCLYLSREPQGVLFRGPWLPTQKLQRLRSNKTPIWPYLWGHLCASLILIKMGPSHTFLKTWHPSY